MQLTTEMSKFQNTNDKLQIIFKIEIPVCKTFGISSL